MSHVVATTPLRFPKARRHLNYVGVGQQGGGEKGKQPTAGTIGPLPRPESRGDAHLTQSRRGKGTVLTGAGPSPVPREEREPTDSLLTPPWTPKGEPVSKKRALSAKRRKYCGCFLRSLAKTLDQARLSQQRRE